MNQTLKARAIKIGLVDKPENQTLEILEWEPTEGNLGLVGKKSSEWLLALAILSAKQKCFEQIFVLDYVGNLELLNELPQCSTVCQPRDTDLRNQIIDLLNSRLTKNLNPSLVIVNNLEALFGDLESVGNFSLLETMDRLFYEGPASGIHWILGLTNLTNSGRRIQKRTYMRIYSGLRTSSDYLEAGILFKKSVDPTKELLGDTGQEIKMITSKNPKASILKIKKQTPIEFVPPKLITLPLEVEHLEIEDLNLKDFSKNLNADLFLPFGVTLNIASNNLETVAINMAKKHLLISGPSASGKSSTLLSLAQAARNKITTSTMLVAICSRNSVLFESTLLFDLCVESLEELEAKTYPY